MKVSLVCRRLFCLLSARGGSFAVASCAGAVYHPVCIFGAGERATAMEPSLDSDRVPILWVSGYWLHRPFREGADGGFVPVNAVAMHRAVYWRCVDGVMPSMHRHMWIRRRPVVRCKSRQQITIRGKLSSCVVFWWQPLLSPSGLCRSPCRWIAVCRSYETSSGKELEGVCGRRQRFFTCYLVDPASSHMLVSKIKPCMSKFRPLRR